MDCNDCKHEPEAKAVAPKTAGEEWAEGLGKNIGECPFIGQPKPSCAGFTCRDCRRVKTIVAAAYDLGIASVAKPQPEPEESAFQKAARECLRAFILDADTRSWSSIETHTFRALTPVRTLWNTRGRLDKGKVYGGDNLATRTRMSALDAPEKG